MFQLNRIKGKSSLKPQNFEQKFQEKNIDAELSKWQEQNSEKISFLIKKAKEGYNGRLVPEIDHKTATLLDIEFCENCLTMM